MADAAPKEGSFAVECPHCRRTFRADLIVGGVARHTGFKCPHCNLFVPYERAAEQGNTA
jgi:transposase-like protein